VASHSALQDLPFTINGGNTLCFVNIDGLLGFEVGDVGQEQ
jgi:hypothetical protein